MSRSFELDLRKLQRAISASPEAASRGARQALEDIKDDWVKEARDVAPLDSRNLRDQIDGKLNGSGLDSGVMVTANASQDGFNYGYYIHELDAGGKSLKLAGAEKKYLDKPAESSESKWLRWVEEEIEEELKREGW